MPRIVVIGGGIVGLSMAMLILVVNSRHTGRGARLRL